LDIKDIKKIGVYGMTGTMGIGITQVCAQAGFEVIGSSRSEERANKAIATLDKTLSRIVEKGKITAEDKAATLGRIKGTADIKEFAQCDLVVEVAVEEMGVKKKVLSELDEICPKHAILATNTSCLSIMEMAMATSRPEKVFGLHFFNPVPLMKLLEVVKTIATSEETLKIGRQFGEAVGKSVVTAQDAPGFIVNRLMVPQLLNAIKMLESGIATREDIDTAINLGLNHPMGPLTLSDLIGLDVIKFIADGVYEEFKDPQFVSPTLLNKMIAAGWLGRKTGKGFYDYSK